MFIKNVQALIVDPSTVAKKLKASMSQSASLSNTFIPLPFFTFLEKVSKGRMRWERDSRVSRR